MKRILSANEIVGFVARGENEAEVCATAQVVFDEVKSAIVVSLDSFVRPLYGPSAKRRLAPGWLPEPERTNRDVPPADAKSVARDIFRVWMRRVRRSIVLPMHS